VRGGSRVARAIARRRGARGACTAIGAALVASACASATPEAKAPEKCPPQTLQLSILASPSVNPTPEGQPRPVVVRVYQMKNDARLFNASFDQVWKDEKATLGEDVFKVDEVQVYPASRADVKIDRNPLVQHIAAVALFQSPKGRSWVTSLDLPPPPEPGKCSPAACAEDDDECQANTVLNARFAFFLDGSKIDDGVEHLDDFPKVGPMKSKRGP
jgi:type VI secretion system protein VasD